MTRGEFVWRADRLPDRKTVKLMNYYAYTIMYKHVIYYYTQYYVFI